MLFIFIYLDIYFCIDRDKEVNESFRILSEMVNLVATYISILQALYFLTAGSV